MVERYLAKVDVDGSNPFTRSRETKAGKGLWSLPSLSRFPAVHQNVHLSSGSVPRSPIGDDEAFTEMLAAEKVFVLPGTLCEIPGYFRISLTANEEMIEQSLPRFARTIEKA